LHGVAVHAIDAHDQLLAVVVFDDDALVRSSRQREPAGTSVFGGGKGVRIILVDW